MFYPTKLAPLITLACLLTAPLCAAWAPVPQSMLTPWGEKLTVENAWRDYPRPALKRVDSNGQLAWTNLNGLWSYAVTALDAPEPSAWAGEILVPFALETPLSGVGRLLDPDEALWYRRTFTLAALPAERTHLNFEAVDYQTEVWLNGHKLGSHTGGHTPFSFDLTAHLKAGENTLVVRVLDATNTEGRHQLVGKQRLKNGGIWYTRSSGIWQTVWLENLPATHIADLHLIPDITEGIGTLSLTLITNTSLPKLSARITARDGERKILTTFATIDPAKPTRFHATLRSEKFQFWTPQNPKLYALDIELVSSSGQILDRVESYAGIRTIGKTRDAAGHLRFTLNGQPLFQYGPLDQGWWPDGFLTPPSAEAMQWEISWLKSAGFNLIRKHIKVEPRAYYALCDQLGMLVWQDQVCGFPSPKWKQLHGKAGHNDRTKVDDATPLDVQWPDAAHEQYMLELRRMVDHLRNHPSIITWIPFNEAWGQHRTMSVGEWLTKHDPSRLINIASGGNFFPIGDIIDAHSYPEPAFDFNYPDANDYIKVVGEFGGHGWPVEGHLWKSDNKKFVYGGMPQTIEEYTARYEKTLADLLALKAKGIAAGIYTQTTDVEVEINGLMTYDRKVIKIPAEKLRALHAPLFDEKK